METISVKYERHRNCLKTGDIILCKNPKWIGRQITSLDDGAYYTHSLVVFWQSGRLFTFDSTETGVHPELASIKMKQYSDFCVVRPQKNETEISSALEKLFQYSEKGIKYDFAQILKIAIYQKTGINIFKKNNPTRDICSELAWYYTQYFPLPCYEKERLTRPFFTPNDFIRYADENDTTILFNNFL